MSVTNGLAKGFVVTDGGFAVIEEQEVRVRPGVARAAMAAAVRRRPTMRIAQWTLRRKAAVYQAIANERHNRYGLVADVSLRNYGNVSNYVKTDDDNDGLWTSIYVASQAFRYGVTKWVAHTDAADSVRVLTRAAAT